MTGKPSSDRRFGLFVSVDGPSGAGKTTIVRHLAQTLVAQGEQVTVTAEPSSGPIGKLASELTETVTGHALACLYAADRYHHYDTEIRRLLQSGHIVVSDRYVASGLVIQRFDGLDPTFLWQLNEEVEIPDLAVILEADADVIAERLEARGPHNRFQLTPGSSHSEAAYYKDAKERLIEAGFTVLAVDCTTRPAEQSAVIIASELRTLLLSSGATR
ncbi:dTMP kinase [Actinokineospora xionganensis]|uniref:Thymidylate kinase n=1 Tax=Actinokineospora xionganensis TaxID=2684470 RepID=A0ABR7L457_9PSEU|nr:dTMP kinase [Actinokineospora xionganensis]MBC6447357.1 dTMP kinase [Actinokineospora xionganensis]